MKSVFNCQVCNYESCSFESFSDLVIDPVSSVESSLTTSMAGRAHKYCVTCDNNTLHSIHSVITEQPKIACIRVNQFKYINNEQQYCKNTSKIICNQFISSTTMGSELIGMICHKGPSTHSGHYTALVKNNNIWYHCNDLSTDIVEYTQFSFTSEVYILFYRRC